MRKRKKFTAGILAAIAMLIVILDGKSAITSIQDGIELCLRTVIPALFPFFVLSGILNSCFIGQRISFMTPLRKLCRIPEGSESILLIGMISGYPVGAQLVADAYTTGELAKSDAQRMLGFCSNAGPAFIFGILSNAFTNTAIPWILWGIHILSAIITAWLLPGGAIGSCRICKIEPVSPTKALHTAIKNMVTVCGWILLFRLILAFLKKWVVRFLPVVLQILVAGCLELSNGCLLLNHVQGEDVRFILASVMLALGGLCVAMQTVSVTDKLGTGLYFPGKMLQMLCSMILCIILQPLLFYKLT